MKKLLLAFAAVAALVGCDKDDDKVVYKAEINLSEVTVYAGNTKQLDAKIEPATEVVWEWTSSDEAVATVDGNGMVTAVAPGETTIKASTTVGGGIVFDECKVTVVAKPTIALDKSEAEIFIGKTVELVATTEPADATITWETTNAAVAKVENGVVTAIAEGEATIVAKVENGDPAVCKITVKKPTIALDKSEATVNLGKTLVLTATVQPADAQVTWSSNNETVATVENGTVTGVAEGEATITAKIGDDIFAECKVTVKNAKIYKIGDIVEFGGEKGIVFWLTEDGTGGKAVSFKQSGTILWSNGNFNCAANSEEDGEFNTDKIKQVGFDYHPAAKWCVDLGDGWYMPAVSEGEAFIAQVSILNPILAANGGAEIKDSNYDWYWSSTEGENDPAFEVLCFYGDGKGGAHGYGDDKMNPEGDNIVRAVHKF